MCRMHVDVYPCTVHNHMTHPGRNKNSMNTGICNVFMLSMCRSDVFIYDFLPQGCCTNIL